MPSYEEKKTRRRNWLDTIAKAVLAGIFAVSVLLNVVLIIIVVVMSLITTEKDRELVQKGYKKIYADEKFPFSNPDSSDEIAVIQLNGIISEYDTSDGFFGYSENPVSAVRNRLNIIRGDKNIRGVLLVIESPGGSVTASDLLYSAIREFRSQSGIPVVSFIRQMAASGGYYVASAADAIVAYPTAVTGSIGVIMYNFNFKGLMDKYGVEYVAVKSSKHKDTMSPFKEVDTEEIAWMQGIVDHLLDRFIDAVAEGRKVLTRDQVESLADGRLYVAEDARTLGLVDEIGHMKDAVKILSDLAGVTSPAIVEFSRGKSFLEMLGQVSYKMPHLLTGLFLRDTMHTAATKSPAFYYMLGGTPFIE